MPAQIDQLRRLRIDRTENGPKSPAKIPWKPILIAAAIVLAALAYLMLRWSIGANSSPQVQTARARAETMDASGLVLSATGYIVAHHRVDVNSKVTGRVAWFGVEKGDKVRMGQVLVRLEDQEFKALVDQSLGEVRSAEAALAALLAGSRPQEIQRAMEDLSEAEATLANDTSQYARAKNLYEQGLIPAQQFDEANARHEAALHRVDSLRQTYQLAVQGPRKEDIERARGELESAKGKLAFNQAELDATQIRAPVDGTILERTAEKGELVTAQFASAQDTGGPRGSVVALADLNDLQVEVDISQDDFAKLNGVKDAVITTDVYPDRQYAGLIAQVAPEANRQKASVQLRVQIVKPDDFLRPEMNANVNFISKTRTASGPVPIEVPFSSVIARNGNRIVLVVSGGRAFEKQIRWVGKKTTGYLVEGINDGDLVIIDPPPELKDGAAVKVNRP